MQHSSFRFRHSTFHKQQSSFRIRPSSSVECTFICLHPTFSICPLSFRFWHSTFGIALASFRIRHWTFPAGQRAMEIVDSIELTHPCSNGGRETCQWSGLGRPSPPPINQTSTTDRTWPRGYTVFEGGECCPSDCLLWWGSIRETNREAPRYLFASLQLNLSLNIPAEIVLSFISAVNWINLFHLEITL